MLHADSEVLSTSQLKDLVGARNVVEETDALDAYSSDMSFVRGARPLAIVRPSDASQVLDLVKWANRTQIPLVPVSSGGPHFRGDTVPEQSGVVVDLSGMKKIHRIDRRNRVAMIEPGVTFADILPEAARLGMRPMLPLAPRANKSVIGSYLEREPFLVPRYHWDMSDPLCCTEVVFGSGDLFRTGSAAGPGTLEEQWASGQAQKNPLGPGPTDFFRVIQGSQGALGIVTWATIRLELLPSVQGLYMAGCERLEDIVDFVYRILRLKLCDECFVLDRFNLASLLEEEGPAIEGLAANLPPYVLIFVLAGYDRFPAERIAYQTQDMQAVAGQLKVRPLKELPGVSPEKLLSVISHHCAGQYWKLRRRGNSTDILFLTTMDRTPVFIDVMKESALQSGFPLDLIGTYIQPVQQGRACHVEFSLAFDPRDSREADRAKTAMERASAAMLQHGGFFSRPYEPWSSLQLSRNPNNAAALKKVKRIFDPNGIMNPGKIF